MIKLELVNKKKSSLFDPKKYEQAFDKALDKTATQAQAALRKSVSTFSSPPGFDPKTDKKYSRKITTKDKKFAWVNEGTPAHIIRARRADQLFIAEGSSPKTIPGGLDARPGNKGNLVPGPKEVRHPGTKPRLITKNLGPKVMVIFKRQLKNNIGAIK